MANLKDIFDKELMVESKHVRKALKIIYEINIELIKPQQEEQPAQQQVPAAPAPAPTPDAGQQPPADTAVPAPDMGAPASGATPAPTEQAAPEQGSEEQPEQNIDVSGALASTVTEEDTKSINAQDENKIVRKMAGEVALSEDERDNIQSVDDIISKLVESKKEGTQILDDFSSEIITLCTSQNVNELKTKIDKKSKIFVEIFYGYNKDDSIGFRISKRPNSDSYSQTMMLDNEIISAKFSVDRINQKVIEFRNYEAKRK